MKTEISIIDNNLALLSSLSMSLSSHGFKVTTFDCPMRALKYHSNQPADFSIIEMKMPKPNGYEFYESLCKRLTAKRIPAILLTAVEEEESRCLTQTTIADFIKKPFNLSGLIARINKILFSIKQNQNEKVYKIGNLILHEEKILCTWFNSEIELTKKEFSLLSRLAHRPHVVFSRNTLLEICYNDDLEVTDRSIDSHIKRLRKKFKKVHPNKKFNRIKTYYGTGYAWHPQSISQ